MDKTVFFDHCYTIDQKHIFLKKLAKLGFAIDDVTVNHPNSSCRFILFPNDRYLEFVYTSNPKRSLKPGIAFGSSSSLEAKKEKLQKLGLQCEFEHRNYNWKENNKDRLPGWNYVLFKSLGIRTFYPWFNSYDPPRRPKTLKDHPNKVIDIIGHEFAVNEKGIEFFSKILGVSIKDKTVLRNGETFYFKKGKTNLYTKVILSSSNLKKTKSFMKSAEDVEYEGKQGLLIRNPLQNNRMWEIVIVEV